MWIETVIVGVIMLTVGLLVGAEIENQSQKRREREKKGWDDF